MKNWLPRLLVLAIVIGSLTGCATTKRIEFQSVVLRFNDNEWPEQVDLLNSSDHGKLREEWHRWQRRDAEPINAETPGYRLEVLVTEQEPRVFFLTHDVRVFDESMENEYLPPPHTDQVLRAAMQQLNSLRFGELLAWDAASRLLPRFSTFELMDLETGFTWKAQRRAGSSHADIQPLTNQDTQQLKAAYGRAWSWDRRAVVVLTEGRRIAASINRMPHGAGALRNGFPGHHCLHFLGSTTHTKSQADLAHQVMVHKAAGKLHSYLAGLDPIDLQLAMLEMAGQGDVAILRLGIANPADGPDPTQLAKQIRNIKIWDSHHGEVKAGRLVSKYNVSVYYHGDAKEYRKSIQVTSGYREKWNRWLVEPDFLYQLVGQ